MTSRVAGHLVGGAIGLVVAGGLFSQSSLYGDLEHFVSGAEAKRAERIISITDEYLRSQGVGFTLGWTRDSVDNTSLSRQIKYHPIFKTAIQNQLPITPRLFYDREYRSAPLDITKIQTEFAANARAAASPNLQSTAKLILDAHGTPFYLVIAAGLMGLGASIGRAVRQQYSAPVSAPA